MTDAEAATGESRDGAGSGDRDKPFVWGQHGNLLRPWEMAHLLILRGYVKDHQGAIEGDSDWVVPTPSGLYVPSAYKSGDS
jgi:hypothetical protein